MKKYLLLLCCCLLCFSFLTACGESDNTEKIDDTPAYTAIDLDGYDFIISGYQRDGYAELVPEVGDSELGDRLISHYAKVAAEFNCTITTYDAAGSEASRIQKAMVSQIKDADIVDMWLDSMTTAYKSGYLLPIKEIIDETDLYEGKYGTKSQLDAVTFMRPWGMETFGFKSAYWGLPSPTFTNICYFNPKLIKEFQQANPFELIENKNWDWNNFEKICVGVISQGVDPNDKNTATYGVGENPDLRYTAFSLIASNGVKALYFDEEEGIYKCGLDSQATIDALTFGNKLFEAGAMKIRSGNAPGRDFGYIVEDFILGRSAFLIEYSYHGTSDKTSMSYTDGFEFSWIPVPVGPSGTWGKWASQISFADRYLCFPAGGADEDVLQAIVPALFEPFEGMDKYAWRDIFSRRLFFEEESRKWFFEMYDNAEYNYHQTLPIWFSGAYTTNVLQGKKSASEVIATVMSKAQAEIDKNYNKFILE